MSVRASVTDVMTINGLANRFAVFDRVIDL